VNRICFVMRDIYHLFVAARFSQKLWNIRTGVEDILQLLYCLKWGINLSKR